MVVVVVDRLSLFAANFFLPLLPVDFKTILFSLSICICLSFLRTNAADVVFLPFYLQTYSSKREQVYF